LNHVARQCVARGIEFTAEHRRFLKELRYAITLRQQLARRSGKHVIGTPDLLRAWDERLDRLAADESGRPFGLPQEPRGDHRDDRHRRSSGSMSSLRGFLVTSLFE
jgi:hypothetical protein